MSLPSGVMPVQFVLLSESGVLLECAVKRSDRRMRGRVTSPLAPFCRAKADDVEAAELQKDDEPKAEESKEEAAPQFEDDDDEDKIDGQWHAYTRLSRLPSLVDRR